jgi:hypothetical protein
VESLHDGVLSGGLSGSSNAGTSWEFENPVIVDKRDGAVATAEGTVRMHVERVEIRQATSSPERRELAPSVSARSQLKKRYLNDGFNQGQSFTPWPLPIYFTSTARIVAL